jgi:hypothetical protein
MPDFVVVFAGHFFPVEALDVPYFCHLHRKPPEALE